MGKIHSRRLLLDVVGFVATGAFAGGAHSAVAQEHGKQAAGAQEPSTLAVSIPWQWLASTGGTMTFQCEAKRPADDDGMRMIEAETRAGRQGRYAGKGGDGGTFTGVRNGDDFTFEAISKDGSKFAMRMPWLNVGGSPPPPAA